MCVTKNSISYHCITNLLIFVYLLIISSLILSITDTKTSDKPSLLAGPTLPPASISSPSLSSNAQDLDNQNNHENAIHLTHPTNQQQKPSSTKQPAIDNNNGIHPLYPTADGRPPKGIYDGVKPLEKPQKKPTKGDKFPGPFVPIPPAGSGHQNKYEFGNYDDVDDDDINNGRPPQRPNNMNNPNSGGPGPGFFNPSATKNQFPDYDQGLFQQQRPQQPGKPNAFNPFVVQQHGGAGDEQDKLPPELFNILGGNAQNIPPHLRIEHLLQQIQGGAGAGSAGNDGQHPLFGLQGGFPFGGQQQVPSPPQNRPGGQGKNTIYTTHKQLNG